MTLGSKSQEMAYQISDDLVCTCATAEELRACADILGGDYFNHICDVPDFVFRKYGLPMQSSQLPPTSYERRLEAAAITESLQRLLSTLHC